MAGNYPAAKSIRMPHMLTSPEINAYAEQMTTPESDTLATLNRETYAGVEQPNMLSGHLQGGFLTMVSQMIQPAEILEIGTYTGYSAINLAQGLQEGGQLHTIDSREGRLEMCRRHWQEAGLEDVIIPHVGKAADVLPGLKGPFQLVFIDADKVNYGLYYDLIFDKVPAGGYILADNVLFHAEVILPHEEQSKSAKAMHAFNEKIKNDDRVTQVLVPVRDGILIIRKN